MTDSDQQEAIANKLAQQKLSQGGVKNPVYLITTVDAHYVALKKVHEVAGVGFQGFLVDTKGLKQLEKVRSKEDALEFAQKTSKELEDLLIPWHRVYSVKSLSYQKQVNK